MDAQVYWKFRFQLERVDRMREQAERARHAAYAEAGLDPAKNYTLNDETAEIVEATPSKVE